MPSIPMAPCTRSRWGRLRDHPRPGPGDPAALVILTGGVPPEPPDRGQADGGLAGEKGIDRSRIIEENYATSTVENALYSGYAPPATRLSSPPW